MTLFLFLWYFGNSFNLEIKNGGWVEGNKNFYIQGSYGLWKTWEVMEFWKTIFQARKVMKFLSGS